MASGSGDRTPREGDGDCKGDDVPVSHDDQPAERPKSAGARAPHARLYVCIDDLP